MKLAFISPINHLFDLPNTRYYNVLAHLIAIPKYASFVKMMRRQSYTTIILDNGAAEMGALPPSRLIQIARLVQPDILVAPDVRMKPKQTIEFTGAFLRSADWEAFKEEFPETKLMLVPQGHNEQEWCRCLDRLLRLASAEHYRGSSRLVIGLGSETVRYGDDSYVSGRVGIARQVWIRDPNMPIHILGMCENIAEISIFDCLRTDKILGTDTALPWVLAARGLVLHDEVPGLVWRPTFAKKWHSDELAAYDPYTVRLAQQNANIMLSYIKYSRGIEADARWYR